MSVDHRWPILYVKEEIVRKNARSMLARAKQAGCELRPHFKTHQSAEIGEWLREEGISAITVSSYAMAMYFANAGWKDILIAMPANLKLVGPLAELAQKLDRLILMADHPDTISGLAGEVKADVVIEVDTGSDRSGVPFNAPGLAGQMAKQLQDADGLNLAGFYSHAGHTYRSRSEEEIKRVGDMALDRLLSVRDSVSQDIPVFFGDTPYASCGERLQEVSVMTPGNFVFYDVMQMETGSCTWNDVAICLACPVVSVHPERNELVIHGGAVHLGKDTLDDGSFGRPVHIGDNGWSAPMAGARVRTISQEHGVIALPEGEVERWKPGDVLGVLPVHSCMTADAMGVYDTFDGRILSHLKKEKPV